KFSKIFTGTTQNDLVAMKRNVDVSAVPLETLKPLGIYLAVEFEEMFLPAFRIRVNGSLSLNLRREEVGHVNENERNQRRVIHEIKLGRVERIPGRRIHVVEFQLVDWM